MHAIRTYPTVLVLAAAAVLTLSACGGGTTGSASPSGGSGGAQTVAVATIGGVGAVLVDSQGNALYSADQEARGKILCTGSCTAIWRPLILPAGNRSATAEGALGAKLGAVIRPDGAEQVTFEGRALYRFAEDSGPGTVSGDGLSDSFGGKSFTWQVAAPGPITGTSTSSGGGYGY